MMRLTVFALPMVLISMVSVGAGGQMSISSLRAAAESSNLELVILQGTVHLTRPHRQQLGGTCGATAVTLVDDSGSIEVTVRRLGRLLEPLRDGDRVQVTAQVHVFRNNVQLPVLVCVVANVIQHLHN
jgi:hypothetical protein